MQRFEDQTVIVTGGGRETGEVTQLVLFLASSEASFSTGSEFLVDGGLLLDPALPRGPLVTSAA